MSLLSEEGRTLATIRVTQACVAMYLQRSAYEKIISQFPTFATYVEAVARLRLKPTVDNESKSIKDMLEESRGHIINRNSQKALSAQRGVGGRCAQLGGRLKSVCSANTSRVMSRLSTVGAGGLGGGSPNGRSEEQDAEGDAWEAAGQEEDDEEEGAPRSVPASEAASSSRSGGKKVAFGAFEA